jgi:hypothetical protein
MPNVAIGCDLGPEEPPLRVDPERFSGHQVDWRGAELWDDRVVCPNQS